MYFLAIVSACNDPALASVLSIIKNIMSLIQILGPIVSLIALTIHLTRLVKNPDDKKGLSKIKNSINALVVLFFVPVIVNAVFGMLDDTTTFSSCWNNASSSVNSGGTYIPIDDDNRTSIYTDPSEYQNGSKKPSGNSSSGNSNSSNSSSSGTSSGTGTGDRAGSGNTSSSRVVFIGDSRTVQMYAYLNNNWNGANYSSGGVHVVGNDIYVSEGAMGLNWMKNTGIPAAKQYFTSGTAIVILMGVNDLGNAKNYIDYVNSNVSKWKANGSSLYFVSVNPCDGKYSHLNSKIQNFNAQVKNGLSSEVGWIDTHSQLNSVGFSTTDGLHYNKGTYQTIYNYIKSRV